MRRPVGLLEEAAGGRVTGAALLLRRPCVVERDKGGVSVSGVVDALLAEHPRPARAVQLNGLREHAVQDTVHLERMEPRLRRRAHGPVLLRELAAVLLLVRACRAWQLRWSDRHGDLSKVQLALLRLVQHVGAAGLESAAVVRAAVGGPNWDESRRAPVGLDPLTGTAVPKAWGQAAMLEHLLRHDAPGGDGVVTELAEHKCLNPVVALLVYYRQGGLLEQLQAPPALEDDHECSGCGRHTPREAVWDAEADGDDFVQRFNEAMDQEGSMEPCPGCGILHHSRDLTKKHLDELGHLVTAALGQRCERRPKVLTHNPLCRHQFHVRRTKQAPRPSRRHDRTSASGARPDSRAPPPTARRPRGLRQPTCGGSCARPYILAGGPTVAHVARLVQDGGCALLQTAG